MPYSVQESNPIGQAVGIAAGVYKYVQQQKQQKQDSDRAQSVATAEIAQRTAETVNANDEHKANIAAAIPAPALDAAIASSGAGAEPKIETDPNAPQHSIQSLQAHAAWAGTLAAYFRNLPGKQAEAATTYYEKIAEKNADTVNENFKTLATAAQSDKNYARMFHGEQVLANTREAGENTRAANALRNTNTNDALNRAQAKDFHDHPAVTPGSTNAAAAPQKDALVAAQKAVPEVLKTFGAKSAAQAAADAAAQQRAAATASTSGNPSTFTPSNPDPDSFEQSIHATVTSIYTNPKKQNQKTVDAAIKGIHADKTLTPWQKATATTAIQSAWDAFQQQASAAKAYDKAIHTTGGSSAAGGPTYPPGT